MSKTNHRINKDREEKLGESYAHKKRRNFKQQASEVVDIFDTDEDVLLDYLDDEQFETVEKIRRRR